MLSSQLSRTFSHAASFREEKGNHCICLTTFLIQTTQHVLLYQISHVHRHACPFIEGFTPESLLRELSVLLYLCLSEQKYDNDAVYIYTFRCIPPTSTNTQVNMKDTFVDKNSFKICF